MEMVTPSVDNAGRISKQAFLVSTSVLFGAVLVSLAIRLCIRLYLQKRFSVDDGLIVFGVLLLIAAMGMLYYFVDMMFLAEALLLHDNNVGLSSDIIEQSLDFEKWAAISLITTWVAVNSVKLSFLSLFRKLIDRIRPMIIYWWFILAYTIAVALYGVSVYIAPCPTFYSFKALTCSQGPRVKLTLKFSVTQMTLDALGDILILVIPIRIIYKLQVRLAQKIVLGCSLCLSVAMIAMTLTRASGIVNKGGIDATWETYWQYLSAEIGLLMAAATAFRTLFIVRSRRRPDAEVHDSWYTNALQKVKRVLRYSRRSNYLQREALGSSEELGARNEELVDLPQIPRPTMTGIRTFIFGSGKGNWTRSQVMGSHNGQDSTQSQILHSRTIDVDYEYP